jgi:transcriptional regulator with XRE-family HTH domain
VLSEFIDAWNAGRRPEVDDFIARVREDERASLADELLAFLTFAPTPEYSDAAMTAIRAEPVVAEARAASEDRSGLFPGLLVRLRERFGMSTNEVAGQLVDELGLTADRLPKTAGYLERLEHGQLEPTRVSRRVFEALARVFGMPADDLEGSADVSRWSAITAQPAAAPVFRATENAAAAAERHLEVLADALVAPGSEQRDEVDELFLGGR